MEEVAQVIYEVELIIDGNNVKETVERYLDDRNIEPLIEIRRVH